MFLSNTEEYLGILQTQEWHEIPVVSQYEIFLRSTV